MIYLIAHITNEVIRNYMSRKKCTNKTCRETSEEKKNSVLSHLTYTGVDPRIMLLLLSLELKSRTL